MSTFSLFPTRWYGWQPRFHIWFSWFCSFEGPLYLGPGEAWSSISSQTGRNYSAPQWAHYLLHSQSSSSFSFANPDFSRASLLISVGCFHALTGVDRRSRSDLFLPGSGLRRASRLRQLQSISQQLLQVRAGLMDQDVLHTHIHPPAILPVSSWEHKRSSWWKSSWPSSSNLYFLFLSGMHWSLARWIAWPAFCQASSSSQFWDTWQKCGSRTLMLWPRMQVLCLSGSQFAVLMFINSEKKSLIFI